MICIEKIKVYHIKLPLKDYFEISSGKIENIDTILVKLKSNGEIGWGEAAPWGEPIYGSETALTAFKIIENIFAPKIINYNGFDSPKELNNFLDQYRGNYFAKAAIETAFWVLYSRLKQRPLHKLLGGNKKEVTCGNSLGIKKSNMQLIKDIKQSLRKGYKRVKIKIRPGLDVEIIDKVRKEFPNIPLQVDANSAYTLNDKDIFKKLDKYQLLQIEQPLSSDDLLDHSKLQKYIDTPICLDESIKTPEHARKAAELNSCKIINIKISRVGGLYKAKKIHDICQKNKIKCWVGGMLESAIGQSIAVEFATMSNIKMPSDIFPTDRFFDKDLSKNMFEMSKKGIFYPYKKPGIKHEPSQARLDNLKITDVSLS